jgi:hypothetical protein
MLEYNIISAFHTSFLAFSSWNVVVYLKSSRGNGSVQHRGPIQGQLKTAGFCALWRFEFKHMHFESQQGGFAQYTALVILCWPYQQSKGGLAFFEGFAAMIVGTPARPDGYPFMMAKGLFRVR